ncbi:Uncharacterized protein PKNOH_S120160800 [Plasmodium knowlesi]|uniref:Uncharacterized protein n=1 Tax=Plasmodium knowlesi TaxID=5850 RepID=A0A1Y3DLN5_PLAKN|nr:Uncharacterized protein PKNOH_S120160800 [Plasmodium knowlesi]
MSDLGKEKAPETLSDDDSSDSYYKSNLLKNKIRKNDIEQIIKNDPILSNINRALDTKGEVFCLATNNDNSKGDLSYTSDGVDQKGHNEKNEQNGKKPKNGSVVYFKEPTLTHKEINLEDSEHAKTDKREYPNGTDGTDDCAPLKNKCVSTSGGTKKNSLSSGKNKNKKKIAIGVLNDAYRVDGAKSPPGDAPRCHIGKTLTTNDEKKKKELSPLAIIKKHGRLVKSSEGRTNALSAFHPVKITPPFIVRIATTVTVPSANESPHFLFPHGQVNQINEIHIRNDEEIEHLRNEYASLKNDLHKIMSIMNVGQRAVSSLK